VEKLTEHETRLLYIFRCSMLTHKELADELMSKVHANMGNTYEAELVATAAEKLYGLALREERQRERN